MKVILIAYFFVCMYFRILRLASERYPRAYYVNRTTDVLVSAEYALMAVLICWYQS